MREAIIQIVTGTLGCLGFGVLFNIRGKRLLGAAFGGFLSWTIFLLCGLFSASDPLNYFIAATITTFYGEIMARVLKTPATTFVITSLIPLIPGGSLYYTMAYAYEKSENFLSKGIETLLLAAALALGIIVATTITNLINNYMHARALRKK